MNENDEKKRLNTNKTSAKRRSPSPRPFIFSTITKSDNFDIKERLTTNSILSEKAQFDKDIERTGNIVENTDSQLANVNRSSFNRSCRRLSSYVDEDDELTGPYLVHRKNRQYARKSADSDFGQRFRRLSSEIGYSSERTDIANAGIIPEALLNDIGSSVDGLDSDNRKDIRKKYQVIDDEDFGQTDLNVEY